MVPEAAMRFGVLGPLEVVGENGAIPLRGAKPRVLLAVLLCRANQPVSIDTLADCMWPRSRPPSAGDNLRGYVHQLRRTLPCRDRLVHGPVGYQLTVRDGELDLADFRELAARGQRAIADGHPGMAGRLLHQAMALWRGRAFGGLPEVALLRDEAYALEEYRLDVLEEQVSADLAVGGHGALVAELRRHVAAYPLRERFHAQLMLALYRSGRQADALQAYQDCRERLVAELGIEPGPELQKLQLAILTADPVIRDPGGRAWPVLLAGVPELAAAPPRIADPPPRPQAQLPADVTCFTGRSSFLRELDALAAAGRRTGTGPVVALITGTAGVGKTAIAVHWAHSASAKFPDGQLYVQLRGHGPGSPVSPAGMLGQLLRALGMEPHGVPVETDEAAAAFRSVVAGRRLLFVLDDAFSAEQVRPLLPGAGACMVVLTSRNRLSGLVARDGARRLSVTTLPVRDASRLVRRLIGTQQSCAAESTAVAELARLCAYLPLALRIAAANLTSQHYASVVSYVARLAAADRVAELRADRDEQACVRTAFDVSYGGLDDAERVMFRLLGIAPGPDIGVAAAASLAGLPPEHATALLDRLAAACLVDEHAPGRYQCHDLLRLYARGRAIAEDGEPDRRAALERLAGWYLCRVRAAADLLYPHLLRLPDQPSGGPPWRAVVFPDRAAALSWLETERANLVASTVHAAEHGLPLVAVRLADELRGFFACGRHLSDWLTAGQAALTAAELHGGAQARTAILLGLGHAQWCVGRYAAAKDHYFSGLRHARIARWHDAQATILGNLGLICREVGEPALAVRYLRLAVAGDRRSNRIEGLANNLANLGYVLTQLGQLDQAFAACEESLLLFRRRGARLGEAHALANTGAVLRHLGQLDLAEDRLSAALTIYREVDDRSNEADTLNSLAEVQRDAGRYGHALELAYQGRRLAARAGDQRAQADCLITAASVHQHLAQYRQAIRQERKALRLARTTGTRYQQATAAGGLALARQSLDRVPAAAEARRRP